MSTAQIETYRVQQFASTIEMLVQQKDSRFASAVAQGSYVGKQASPVEQTGIVTANKRTTRATPLVPTEVPADRRWVFPVDYDWNTLVDNIDTLRMRIDPKGSYTMSGTAAMRRAQDDEIINAFFGTAKTGEDASTSTTFPAGQQVSASAGAAAATGLNVEKLRIAKEILLAAEVDVEMDPLYIGISAKQHSDLLREIQITSLDFNDRPVLVDGMVRSFLGFNFIHSERLPVNGSSQRRLPCWAKSGMHLGMWQGISTDISQRKDLAGLPWQVYVYGTFGATRLQEKKVVEIPCVET